jgi:K+-transporting ATPase ATPase C chain
MTADAISGGINMLKSITKSLWLLGFSVVICCVIYPGIMWVIGQVVFPFQANGSMVKADGSQVNHPDGTEVGSLLIAQPFTKAEYFQARPSACSYDASASSSQAWAASNYQLRNRVATQLGPIVTYKSGPKSGQSVAPDIEAWFQKDQYQGGPSIVAQWADAHNGLAQAWVTGDSSGAHGQYITDWEKAHQAVVQQFVKNNPGTPQPQPSDLAVVFFETFSRENPGKFPSGVTYNPPTTLPSGVPATQPTTIIQPVSTGSDIQSDFFDMWRQDHPDADLQEVPGDFVTTSGSGLDPHITLQNAEYQLPGIAAQWAQDTKRDVAAISKEIDQILQKDASAPMGGMWGEEMINVLQVNVELRQKYGPPA